MRGALWDRASPVTRRPAVLAEQRFLQSLSRDALMLSHVTEDGTKRADTQ